MKQKRLAGVFCAFVMLLALLPNLSAVATVDSTMKFKLVTSADELVVGAKYLIVGYDADEAVYYALGDETGNENSGMRSPAKLKDNGDGTLSALDQYDISIYPLVMELSKQYVTSENKYSLRVDTSRYLNAFYSYKKAYAFSETKSKSLPIDGFNGVSEWEQTFREDGTVLFKTTKTIDSVEQSSYIRFFHYQSGSMTNPAFSGGLISDSNIDLPQDGSLTIGDLTEMNIPVKTYLYKEVCAHDAANLTFYEAKASTCSTHGNIAYYYCSNCCGYLKADKTTEIKLADTVLPLTAHKNTRFVLAAEPTCQAHGNIDYTYCADCGKYFEGDSTENPIEEKDAIIASVNHSYVDGVCRFCDTKAENAYFARSASPTGNGHRYIFVAEYGGKFYAMGDKCEKGMRAVEVEEAATGKFLASSENAVFAEVISSDETKTLTGTSINYTPDYIKIGQNYLTNNSLTLTLDYNKDTSTYWRYKWGYNANGNYVNYYCDDPNDNAMICLVTGDGEPYFSMCTAEDSTHIMAYSCGEVCSHANNLVHTERHEPTCTKDGNIEYWYCGVCDRYFSDNKGLKAIEDYDIPLLSVGAKDEDDNDICDLCGKPMPVYTKVTKSDEIVMGNKYILVSEIGESLYTLKLPEAGKNNYYDLGNSMTAKNITAEDDGKIKFNSAKSAEAIMINLGFACECTDLDNGSIRYALRTTTGNKVLNLESYGSFTLMELAKYGWRIALNEDGSIKMADVYDENWKDGNGLLRVYKLKEGENTSVFFSSSESSAHTKEGEITQYPVYLYRLTETGTINGGLHTYTLNDAKSPVSQSITVPSESAAAISNISGVSQALTKDAINGFVTKAAAGENVRMNVVVGITASDSTEADKDTGGGASITYTISPKVNVATDSNPTGTEYDIPDTAFDGSPMKVMLYTGGVEPQQIVHIKQDGTKEYFYPEGSEKVVQNGEKAFTMSMDSNKNTYVTLTVTEFSDIKLLETPETSGCAILEYNEKERTVSVSCDTKSDYAIIFADFEKDGLYSTKVLTQTLQAGTVSVDLPKDVFLSYGDKIFLWDNMKNMRPLCEEYTIK